MERNKGMSGQDICRAAVERWGAEAQTRMAAEEMAELVIELCRQLRGRSSQAAIAEEIADVRIMLDQMELLYDCVGEAAQIKRRKLARLAQRLEREGGDGD